MNDFINIELQYLALCLSTLFALVNPLGITPIFVAMTDKYSNEDKIKIDLVNKRVDVLLDSKEIEFRKKNSKFDFPNSQTPWQEI